MSSQAQEYWKIPDGHPDGADKDKPLGPEFARLKQDIIAQYGKEKIWQSWLQVTRLLEEENSKIIASGSSLWPEVDFAALDRVPKAKLHDIKERGIVIIRNVFPENQAKEWLSSLDKYIKDNRANIPSYPEDNPWNYKTYFSPVQNQVRSHPNSLKTQEFINNLWEGYKPDVASAKPLSFADGIRFRRPGGFSPTVRPHIDAGSLDRWGDEAYRHYYDGIFSGGILAHNPYDLKWRIDAESAKYPGRGQSTVFRAFQGWTSLSKQGGDVGTAALAVYPSLRLAISYVLLRPFFKPPEDGSLDPAEWEWDESPTFPGSYEGVSQQLSASSHPHLELEKTLTITPVINPGDAVFWHSDIIHAVDPILDGPDPAAVLYIAAVPLTKRNLSYIATQRESLLNRGETPPDYTRWGLNRFEADSVGYQGPEAITGPLGRQALGLDRLQGEGGIVQWANETLGYA